jgi:cysteine dioxygenase
MPRIEEFVAGLCRIREQDFTVPAVADFLRGNPVDSASLEPYLHFAKTHYTRNLIYRCPLFELIAICWEVGQMSRIHNHHDQNCWMSVPIGRLTVQNYVLIRGEDVPGHCELIESDRLVMDPENPAFVDPGKPIHSVLNLPEYNQRAVSLHVYSRPFDHCLVYSLRDKTCLEVPLFYDTEYGHPADREGSKNSKNL